jgi:hypothetical protein
VAIVVAVTGTTTVISPTNSAATGAAPGTKAANRPTIRTGRPIAPGSFDGDVRRLPHTTPSPSRVFPAPRAPHLQPKHPAAGSPPTPRRAQPANAPMPPPTITFKGLDHDTWGAGHPPDPVGDVGPNHYVQAVNTSIGIFSKTGTQLAAFTFDTLWSGTGTACDDSNAGDPTVVYDPLADRFIVADFAFADVTSPPYYECIAVSKTSDPVIGGWWLFPIRADDASHPWLHDYPKMGIWPDGLYMSANMFCFAPEPGCSSGGTYKEVRVWAFNRSDLESGAPVRNVIVDLDTDAYFSMLPGNMRTAVGAPPAGRDEFLVSESQSLFAFEVFEFHVDYSGSGSTFTGPTNVSQASYTVAAPTVPSPGNSLDSLRERMMMQAQYTNIGGAESLWVNHTIGCCGSSLPTGIQWAQIDVTDGTVATTPVQEQKYPGVSDGLNRWMGSLAVDREGNMALGYSVSNASTDPDIRYAGRLAGDPLGTLPQTETTMLPGVPRGSQTGNCGGSPCERWGDYSAMSLDPDGCTLWYSEDL